MPLQGCIDNQTIKRTSGTIMQQRCVYAENEQATAGYCLYLNARFEVDRQDDIWIERPGTFRPIKGRPPLSEGRRDAFVGANVAPDLKEWAASQPEGISTLINQLLSDERKRRNPV